MQLYIEKTWQHYDASITLGCIESDVKTAPFDKHLWDKITALSQDLRNNYDKSEISSRPNIAAARRTYKSLGQDPSRYRLSAEALTRRIIKGQELYQVNNVVDLVNYISLESGISIGGYDLDMLKGDARLGIGEKDEPYQAIGKGRYNIARLPVLRDDKGAFGTPTSDSQRTSVTEVTRHFYMVFFGFTGTTDMDYYMRKTLDLLVEHAGAVNPVMMKAGL